MENKSTVEELLRQQLELLAERKLFTVVNKITFRSNCPEHLQEFENRLRKNLLSAKHLILDV